MAAPPSAYALLTRLFLRQFLENDLTSPDGDRAQLLAIVGASVVSLTLFISMFMSSAYAMSVLMPGHAAVLTLSDKFFYIALAMLVTALVAAAQWDALAIDQRDAAILQPLPVRPGTLRLAKLTAVAMLGAGVALAVNIFPTLVFPWMLAFAVPQMHAWQVFWMSGVHAAITVTAAVFGYLVVIGLRESASALLGAKLFARVSPWMQTTTIVVLGSAVLMLPVASSRVGQRGLVDWRANTPPMAFVGVYEVVTHGFLADLPRNRMTKPQLDRDRFFSAIYAERRPMFPALARRAELLVVAVVAVVAVATAINALRMPVPSVAGPRRRRRSRVLDALPRLLFPRRSAARAGFDFALATVWRNKTHRLTLACAAAIGLAAMLVSLSGVDLSGETVSARLLVIQPLLYGALLVGFRHLIRVPAELRANWAIQVAWRGQVRPFATGAQAAGLLTLALPALALTVIPVAMVGGVGLAAAHAAIGLVGAAIVLEALMLTYDKVPFTCTYTPAESVRAIAPIYALTFILGASFFARLELAMLTGDYWIKGLAGLFILLAALRIGAIFRPRSGQIEFNEGPPGLPQLGLHT